VIDDAMRIAACQRSPAASHIAALINNCVVRARQRSLYVDYVTVAVDGEVALQKL